MEILSEKNRICGRLSSASTLQTALAALENKEAMVQEDNVWRFVNPAFALWVRHRMALRN